MNPSHAPLKTPVALVAAFFIALLWAYAIGWALIGHPLFRDQHLGAALIYAKDGIDFLRPVIPGFNVNGTGTPQELPLWQAAAALGLKACGGWWGAANIVSLILFTALLPGLFFAAKWELDSPVAGWLALALLVAQPIVFHMAGMAGTDGLSLALLVAFIGASEWMRRRQCPVTIAVCALTAILLSVTKLPFLMVGGVAAALMLLWNKASLRSWIVLILVGLVAAAVFMIWNHWCDAEIARGEMRFRPMTLKENPRWFLGTLAMRLDPAIYIKAGWRALSCLWGSFLAVGFTLYGLWLRPKSLGSALLVGSLVVTMVFFNLVTVHRHYYLMFAPAVALLNTYALHDLLQRTALRQWFSRLAVSLSLALLLLLSLGQGLLAIEAQFNADPFPIAVSQVLARETSPGEKILTINSGWGGEYLIRAQREGLTINDTRPIEDATHRRRLRELGFTKIAIFSESPLLHALKVTNPGSAGLPRILWTDFILSDVAKSWPRSYESEDMVILPLPPN